MLHSFCDTLSRTDGVPLTVVLPDTPAMYDFATRYAAKEPMTRIERTLHENLCLFGHTQLGFGCYGRFALTRVVEPDGTELDGSLALAALDFLDANYQVRVSPWDLIHDPLMHEQLVPGAGVLRNGTSRRAPWSEAELADFRRQRARFAAMADLKSDPSVLEPHIPEPLASL
jgi:hypothetical protein